MKLKNNDPLDGCCEMTKLLLILNQQAKRPSQKLTIITHMALIIALMVTMLIETSGAQNLTLQVNPVKHEGIDHRLVYNRRAPKITQSDQLSKLNQNGEAIVILEPLPGLSAKSIDYDAIGRVGGRVLAESSRLVRVAIHPYQIESLLEVKGVNFIRPPYAAHYNKVTSEGVRLTNVLPNRSRGVSGQGNRSESYARSLVIKCRNKLSC